MHEHEPTVDPNLLEQMGYEGDPVGIDTMTKPLVTFFAVTFIITVITFVIAWFIAPEFVGNQTQPQVRTRIPEAPNPLLQSNVTAVTDTVKLRKEENAKLNVYGWANEQRSKAIIPVNEAMKKVAQAKKLPTFEAPVGAEGVMQAATSTPVPVGAGQR